MGENLAQLMYSVMMTGYMFRNAQYRMDLSESMIASPNENKMGSRKVSGYWDLFFPFLLLNPKKSSTRRSMCVFSIRF